MNSSAIFDLAVTTLAQYGLLEKGWKVAWDNGKRRAGACHYGTRTISLSRHILPLASDEEIRETILHEVAHALMPGHSHDAAWTAKLREMGGTGKRTHSMETPEGRYEVHCQNCGKIGTRHQAQGTWKRNVGQPSPIAYYHHRKCGNGKLWLVDTKGAAPVVTAPGGTFAIQIPVAASTAKPTPNAGRVCYCGCNGTTKGGAYLPGHDARHVSEVFAAWIANRYDLDGAKHVLRHAPKLQAKLETRIVAYVAKNYKD